MSSATPSATTSPCGTGSTGPRNGCWASPSTPIARYGPAIVTADEVGDPHALGIRCFVNGELRQNSNTRHLVFNLWDQIAELSQAMTLEPGDLIFTGTPGGIGFGSKPYRPLKVGDVVRCEVDGSARSRTASSPKR